MAEITAASQEQSDGIGQVNTAVAQMDDVTQQNAALVEEASAAAESMQEQAQVLIRAVSLFKLADDHRSPETAPVVEPRPVVRNHRTRVATVPRPSARRVEPAPALATTAAADDWTEF